MGFGVAEISEYHETKDLLCNIKREKNMKADNGKYIEDYDKITTGYVNNFPGVYCKNCGKVFTLYIYSVMQPHGTDKNGKPFYNMCGHDNCMIVVG